MIPVLKDFLQAPQLKVVANAAKCLSLLTGYGCGLLCLNMQRENFAPVRSKEEKERRRRERKERKLKKLQARAALAHTHTDTDTDADTDDDEAAQPPRKRTKTNDKQASPKQAATIQPKQGIKRKTSFQHHIQQPSAKRAKVEEKPHS